MRVLMLGPAEPADIWPVDPGGNWPRGHGGQPVNDLARHLGESGVDVHVISLSEVIEARWHGTHGRVTVSLVPMRRSPRRRLADLYAVEIRRLKEEVGRSLPYDVIHAHWTYAYAHAALSFDRSALISLHDSPWRLFRLTPSAGLAALSAQTFWTARRARNVVASSPYVGDTWAHDFRGATPRSVMPNLAPDLTGCAHAEQGRLRVISMGHPHPNKNLSALVAAWGRVQRAVPGAHLTITGAGTEAGGEFDLAHGATRRGVEMLGRAPRHELLKQLGTSSVMVHPSLSEACPMSIVEATTVGMPTVVGRQTGPMQWMIGSGGRVVDVRDPAAIADATIELLTDSAEYGKAQRGALEASAKFSPNVLIPKWLSLYTTLAQERER